MPNWCSGCLTISGNPENIKEFAKLFIFEGENKGTDDKGKIKQYFARSFCYTPYNELELEDSPATIGIEFAWSVTSCLIDGYPQQNKHCLTLMEACKKFNVSVEVESSELGLEFEEWIEVNNKGELTRHQERKMMEVKCPNKECEHSCCLYPH